MWKCKVRHLSVMFSSAPSLSQIAFVFRLGCTSCSSHARAGLWVCLCTLKLVCYKPAFARGSISHDFDKTTAKKVNVSDTSLLKYLFLFFFLKAARFSFFFFGQQLRCAVVNGENGERSEQPQCLSRRWFVKSLCNLYDEGWSLKSDLRNSTSTCGFPCQNQQQQQQRASFESKFAPLILIAFFCCCCFSFFESVKNEKPTHAILPCVVYCGGEASYEES